MSECNDATVDNINFLNSFNSRFFSPNPLFVDEADEEEGIVTVDEGIEIGCSFCSNG